MSTPSFYHSALSADTLELILSPDESAHAVKSRRLRVGSEIRVFNGAGLVADGEISEVDRREVAIRVIRAQMQPAPAVRLNVATAIPKGDRQRTLVDMLTQLGVSRIIPLECEHSVTHFKPNLVDRWLRTSIEACKQSQNPWLPEIADGVSLNAIISTQNGTLFVADGAGQPASKFLPDISEITVFIGPEGGFSTKEMELFEQYGVVKLKAGPHILRTEAAGIAITAQISSVIAASDDLVKDF